MDAKNINDIYDKLTEDEKLLIEKIEKRIAASLKDISDKRYDHITADTPIDFSGKHPDIIPPSHISSHPHEIRVSLSVEISSIDEKGYLDEVKELIKKNYHIPVPPEKDYMEYAEKFISNFEDKLTKSCREEISPDFKHER